MGPWKTGWWAEPGVTQKNDKSKEAVQKIKTFFEEARAYAQTAEPEEINLRLEAMRGVFDGNKTVFINANSVKQITQAVNFILEFKFIQNCISLHKFKNYKYVCITIQNLKILINANITCGLFS